MSQFSRPYDVEGGAQILGGAVILGGKKLTPTERKEIIASLEGQIPSEKDRKVRARLLSRLHNNYMAELGYYDDPDVVRARQTINRERKEYLKRSGFADDIDVIDARATTARERRSYAARARNQNPNFFYGHKPGKRFPQGLPGNLSRLDRAPSEYNLFVRDYSAANKAELQGLSGKERMDRIAAAWKASGRSKRGASGAGYYY